MMSSQASRPTGSGSGFRSTPGVLMTPLGLESTFEIFGSVMAALALAVAFEAYRTRPATARLAVETA